MSLVTRKIVKKNIYIFKNALKIYQNVLVRQL